jgi:S1-C subfamily serine protease
MNVEQVPEGTGSGFIWDDQGDIVTNFHVIKNAAGAQVTLADQSTWKARLIGAFPDKDLAVLKIDAPKAKLPPLAVGRSDDLKVGQKVFAIGNPFGLDQTLTNGIISALGREIESVTKRPIKDMIQTNAAINPGNSGGPLLDSAGRVIGVNAAIFSPSGASAGIGFAIPVDEVNRVIPELIRNGKISRPGLGIQVAPDQTAQQLKMEGALIVGVLPDGAATQAGLRPTRRDASGNVVLGDVITAIDGKPIKKAKDLYGALDQHKAGELVKVKVLRDGEEVEVDVTLGNLD